MTELTDFYRDTWYKLQHPSSLDHIIRVLEKVLNRLSSNSLSEDEYELLNQAFHVLQEFTIDDPTTGQKLILTYLMPTIEALRKVESKPTAVISNCRTSLAQWIAQYSDPERMILRDQVLNQILETWPSTDSESACWTISAIGYRRPDIVQALWDIAERHPDSKVGDDALLVLSLLGVPSDKRPRLLKALHERASKRYNLSLVSALSHLADPSSIDIVCAYWLNDRTINVYDDNQRWSLRILLDICDEHETNTSLQDRIWSIVSEYLLKFSDNYNPATYLGSNMVSQCDSPHLISDMVGWLRLNPEKSTHHGRYMFHSYFAEWVRPRQLRGWEKANMERVLEIIQQDAFVDSERGTYPNSKSRVKTHVWNTLLYAAYPETLSWYEKGIRTESSFYMKAQITNLLASFRLQPLPPSILQWITEPYPYQTNGQYHAGELSLRLAAIQLARSAASCEAFRALLDLELTVDGKILQSSVHALADVAVYLVHSGEVEVIRQLVETVLSSAKRTSRIAAAGALESLVAGKLVSFDSVSKLLPLILDETRDATERGILVNMLGFLPVSFLTSDILKALKKWALQREDWLGDRSLETLARLDQLLQEPELLSQRLGLRQIREQWHVSANAERLNGSAFVIGLLYSHHPTRFEPAVVSLVRTENWSVTVQITDLLAKFYEQHPELELPDPIENALFERARTFQNHSVAETESFKFLARLSPNRLALERWQEIWHDWLPAARVALADSLGQAIYTTAEANKRANSLLLLLTRDGQYAVRRAAYRGLSRHAPDSFTSWCHVYADAPEVELRQRAAEAIAWLGNEKACSKRSKPSDLFSTCYQQLATDSEPTVRETAQRIRIERRERLWAEEYLQLLCQVKGECNEEVLSCWRYGQALAQIGNDSTIEALRTHLATTTWPPNVKYWIQQIVKDTKEHWEKKTQKWPEPWFAWEGTIEEGQGVLFYPDSQSCKVRYSLWYKAAPSPKQSSSWGGKVHLLEKTDFKPNHSSTLTLHLEDGRQGRAFAKSYPLWFGKGDEITLLGNGVYPV